MKFGWLVRFFDRRCLYAGLAGLLWAMAFPLFDLAVLGWMAPALLLAAALAPAGQTTFKAGWMAGLVHCLTTLYWLLWIPVTGLPILGWLLLSAYLALYPAVWCWFCRWLLPAPPAEYAQVHSLAALARWLGSPSLAGRLGWALTGAAAWAALEVLRGWLLTGFPWNWLGASQYRAIPLIQLASVTGVPGISFLMVWCSLSVLGAAVAIIRCPGGRSQWLGDAALPLLSLALVLGWGLRRASQPTHPDRIVRITLVQPSFPQTLIWDEAANTNRFNQLIRLTESALTNHPGLLVWPESSVPSLPRFDPEFTGAAITNLAARHGVWLILGADDAEPHVPPRKIDDYDLFNCSFLFSPAGEMRRAYQKQHLVAFGEYVPLVQWLPFLKWFTPPGMDFVAGRQAVPFRMDSLEAATSVLICFEDVFPGLARRAADTRADFLLNLTNNGWFRESAAQWQHAINALFRAVENGLPLVRCGNNGLTCWVDPQGRLRDVFRDSAGTVYGAGFMTIEVPLEPVEPTFYRRHGDWFGWGCAGWSALALLARRRREGR